METAVAVCFTSYNLLDFTGPDDRTASLRQALAGYRVLRTHAELNGSDHLPVSIDLEPAMISSRSVDRTPPSRHPAPVRNYGETVNAAGPHARITGPLIHTGRTGDTRLP
ncbi:hypothetical protein ACF1A9_19925 [Streptomyces sp. NPDC014872]|uniref:hypothetical protein n=1 Tax=Streptomyces sp. NPDC014872 TaxID=3364926 RepID=UPI0036FAB450